MKKNISIVLLLVLLFSSFPITVFANISQESISSSTNQDSCTHLDSTRLDLDIEESPSLELLPLESSINYHFDESKKSFLDQITAEELDLQGYISLKPSKTTSLNNYIAQTQASRFDIINIAYDNSILSNDEKIEAYCTLLEQKKLENVHCLHSIIATLHRYALSDIASEALCERIDDMFPIPQDSNVLSEQSESSILVDLLNDFDTYTTSCSTHFTVYYPTSVSNYPQNYQMITDEKATEVATFFESLYALFANMGFNTPLLEAGNTSYPIVLNPNQDDWGAYARTSAITLYGNTCSTVIAIYEFQELTTLFKETIAHEYFHAIEGAYNWLFFPYEIREPFADWASIAGTGSSTNFDFSVSNYLASNLPMEEYPSYGSGFTLYALTIQKACGTGALVDIYETAAASECTTMDFSQFRTEIVTPALVSWGENFNSIYLKMAGNNYAPNPLYASVHPGGASAVSEWEPRITSTTTTQATSRITSLQTAVSNESLSSFSSNYHVFTPDIAGKDSKIKIQIVYSGTNAIFGVAQCIYKTSDGDYVLETIPRTASLTFTYTHEDYGNLDEFCIITSSLGGSDVAYSISYNVERGTSSEAEINNQHRYSEYVATLNKGEYYDLYVTFATNGRRLIQTFGTLDAFIFLYDNTTGSLIDDFDDEGYGYNPMFSYNFTANKEYKIRVCFYSSTTTGKTKLTITSSNNTMSSYESINPKTDNTSIVSDYLYVNSVNLYTYKFSTAKNLTVNISSNIDVYLYIIDPRSVVPMRAAENTHPQYTLNSPCLYNDDYNTTNQSQITKTFEAGVPYYVIVGMYNPTTNNGSQYYMSMNLYS